MSFFNADIRVTGSDGLILKDLTTNATTPNDGFGTVYLNDGTLYIRTSNGVDTSLSGGGGGGGGVSLTGSTDNTICTVTGTDAIAGEANLTFDGNILDITGYIKQSKGFTTLTATTTTFTDNDITDLLCTFSVPVSAIITEINYLVTKTPYIYESNMWKLLSASSGALNLSGGIYRRSDELNLSNTSNSASTIQSGGNLVSPISSSWDTSTFVIGSNGKFNPNLSTSAYNNSYLTTDYYFTIQAASGNEYANLGGDQATKSGLTFTASTDIWETSGYSHGLSVNDEVQFTVSGGGASGYSTATTYYVTIIPSTTSSVGGDWSWSSSDIEWTTSVDHNLSTGDTVVFATGDSTLTSFSTGVTYYAIVYTSTTLGLADSAANAESGIYIYDSLDSTSAWTVTETTISDTQFKLSSTIGGSVVDGTSDSSGSWSALSVSNNIVSATFLASTDIWTSTTAHGLSVDSEIELIVSGSGAAGYSINTDYFVTAIPNDIVSVGGDWTYDGSYWSTSSDHGLTMGDEVVFTTNGGGLTAYTTGVTYYAVYYSNTTLGLSDTYENALAYSTIPEINSSSSAWAVDISTPSTTQFKLSSTRGGSVIDGTTDSSSAWEVKIIDSLGGRWTFDYTGGTSENLWTTTSLTGLSVTDKIRFIVSGGGASGYSSYTDYYVVSINSTSTNDTIQLSSTESGTVVSGSSDSTSYWQAELVPNNEVKLALTYLLM